MKSTFKVTAALLGLVIFSSAQALPSRSICTQKITALKAVFAQVQDRFSVGEVTSSDVMTAEGKLMLARLQCADITRTEYCAVALPDAQTLLTGIAEEYKVGQRSQNDLQEAQENFWTVKADCE